MNLISLREAKQLGLKRYFTGKPCSLGHIVPLSRGGLNVDSNTQLLCPSCNLSKSTKTMKEWKGS